MNIAKSPENEILDRATVSKATEEKWKNLLNGEGGFFKKIKDCKANGNSVGPLAKYSKGIADEINAKSSSLNVISSMQIFLKNAMEKGKNDNELSSNYRDEVLGKIRSLVKIYMDRLVNIRKKISGLKSLSKNDKKIAEIICKYLDKKKKYGSKIKKGTAHDIAQWASGIVDNLIVSEKADKDIRQWYDTMKSTSDSISKSEKDLEKCNEFLK